MNSLSFPAVVVFAQYPLSIKVLLIPQASVFGRWRSSIKIRIVFDYPKRTFPFVREAKWLVLVFLWQSTKKVLKVSSKQDI